MAIRRPQDPEDCAVASNKNSRIQIRHLIIALSKRETIAWLTYRRLWFIAFVFVYNMIMMHVFLPPSSTNNPPVPVMDSYPRDIGIVNDKLTGSYARQSCSPDTTSSRSTTGTDRQVIHIPAP